MLLSKFTLLPRITGQETSRAGRKKDPNGQILMPRGELFCEVESLIFGALAIRSGW